MGDFLNILKNVFDVFSLAAILFFIYRFAVKRRAFKLVMGVVLFLLVMLIVDTAELTALKFVFGDFRQLGVIAILIIFQPELRSALEKIGGTTYEGIQNINHGGENGDASNSRKMAEAIAAAAQDLSEINYGALIVIERENSLDEYKAGGAYLDGAVTADALKSIFYKGATLHDGAVIIHDGRIEYARCVLPMTSRVDIPSELGTRHRAALGTTEKSDAIVVIVSEESGIISLSLNGELERGYTRDTLSARLDELFNPSADNSKNDKRFKKGKKRPRKQTEKSISDKSKKSETSKSNESQS